MNTPRASSSTRCTGEAVLGPERVAAAACREFCDTVVRSKGLYAGRERMAAALRDLYVRRLRLPFGSDYVDGLCSAIANPKSVVVEIAHDGQLPHLGIVRLVLKAREIAALAGNGIALYLVGDHYTADMRPENLYLGLPLRGVDADRVKNPLTVPVGRKFRHVPFKWLPPPGMKILDELERRAHAWIVNNATDRGRSVSLAFVEERLSSHFDILRESTERTASFGDWLMRVQAFLFAEMFGGPPPGLAILPMSDITTWIPNVVARVLDRDTEVLRMKEEVSVEQRSRRVTPYASGAVESGSFWVYCQTCSRRYRATFEGVEFRARCAACSQEILAQWPEDASRVMPDIVAYETALFRTGIAGWVIGSQAPYHPVIERSYDALFGHQTPPKFFLTSVPRFRGLGEPAEGHTRARLLRVLFEVYPAEVRMALEVPWDQNPVLESPLAS